MRVWLITIGEPLPTDAGTPRLLRTGILASLMHRRGIEVTWWTSNFDHQRKVTRAATPASGRTAAGYGLELLRGRPYWSNVSLARIRNHRQLAADFRARATQAPCPDVILCSYPTIELCEAAIDYGREQRIPVAIDIRDLWPDVFLDLLPAPLQPLGALTLRSMFEASRRTCRGAGAIIGITDAFVDWGVGRAGRQRRRWDLAVPLGYEATQPARADLERARRDWDAMGVDQETFTLCFFGTLGRQFDIATVFEAARRLLGQPVRFVICGDGDGAPAYRQAAADLPNVLMPGWVDAASIRTLMERSAAGLAPYHCGPSFTRSLPNKVVEYMAGGLPLLSCLTGEVDKLLREEQCGITWSEGNAGSLVTAIERLRLEPGLRSQMADNSAFVFRSRFVADTVYGRLSDHLCALAAAGTESATTAYPSDPLNRP